MPNLTAPLPRRTGDLQEDFNELYRCYIALVDEMKNLLCNLDSGNVTEAASIKAQNIDASQAKIKDAQIASLTADKLTAGVIDAGKITVKGTDNNGHTMTMTGETIVFTEDITVNDVTTTYERIVIGKDNNNKYVLTVQNRGGTQGIYMNSSGEIQLTGDINTSKDCRVQGQLIVGNGTDPSSYKGIAFYCKNYLNPSDGYCGGIFPYVIAYSEGSPVTGGICVDTSLYAKSGYGTYSKVVTFDDLQNQSNNA